MPSGLKLNKKTLAPFITALFIITVLAISFFNLKSYFSSSQVLGAQTNTEQPNEKEKLYWEEFLNKNPTYFPGWIELARIEKESGNPLRSFENLNKAREINPNSPLFSLP